MILTTGLQLLPFLLFLICIRCKHMIVFKSYTMFNSIHLEAEFHYVIIIKTYGQSYY
jgi:hypothetical protein